MKDNDLLIRLKQLIQFYFLILKNYVPKYEIKETKILYQKYE